MKEFARLTGDLPVISTVDLRVLALTWMLEKECRGVDHLRTTPPPRAPIAPRRPSAEEQAAGAAEAPVVGAAGAAAMPGWSGEAFGGAEEEGEDGDAATDAEAGEQEVGEEAAEGEGEVEEVLDDVPQRVLPGLYLGSLDAAQNSAALRARGVTHVLTVARELSQVCTLGGLSP